MKLEAPLRLTWLSGIQSATGQGEMNNDRFFNRKIVTVNSVIDATQFTLYVNNPIESKRYFSHEADRFASAAFESLDFDFNGEGLSRSIGWILIRTYYSAFFAVHSLLRISGWSCTRLTTNNINFVNNEISSIHPESPIQKGGLYLLKSNDNGVEISCTKLDSNQGGSHEILWGTLRSFLKNITTNILQDGDANDPNILLTTQTIDSFLSFIDKKGGDAWFTRVRNNLNYSHQYGAWFPYKGSTCDAPRVYNSIQKWTSPPEYNLPNIKSDELIQFTEACSFLISLCSLSIKDLAYRSPSNSPFRQSSRKLLLLLEQKKAITFSPPN